MLYFNDNDRFASKWLRELFPNAEVDNRGIEEVTGEDLKDYERVHLFAGIGGWEYALSLAGWPPGRPVWTGSCPCQPFSAAGKGGGDGDPRNLWPQMARLIEECLPPTIFGEQVASKAGRKWFAGVRSDLEDLDYSVGAVFLPAASVGSPHKRERLWWVAHSERQRLQGQWQTRTIVERNDRTERKRDTIKAGCWSEYDELQCYDGKVRRIEPGLSSVAYGVPNKMGRLRGYGNAIVPQVATEFIMAFLETE